MKRRTNTCKNKDTCARTHTEDIRMAHGPLSDSQLINNALQQLTRRSKIPQINFHGNSLDFLLDRALGGYAAIRRGGGFEDFGYALQRKGPDDALAEAHHVDLACVCVRMYVCIYVCMHVYVMCMRVCVYVYICMCVCVSMYMHVYMRLYVCCIRM